MYFPRSSPIPIGLPQNWTGSAPPLVSTPASVEVELRRCRVRFMLRPAWLLALLCRFDLEIPLRPPRTFTSELSQRKVTLSLSRV